MSMQNLVDSKTAAEILGVSVAFLERDRWEGARIPFCKVGKRAVRYRLSDLEKYIEKQIRQSTSESDEIIYHAAVSPETDGVKPATKYSW